MDDNETYRKAEKRVKDRLGFYSHFAVYVIVNIILYIINRMTAPGGYQWFIWPLMGWGIAVLFHFMDVFVLSGNLKERMIRKELERQKRRQG
jgi:uncharacterized protein YhhL (DUF1145 family)